MDFFDLDNRSRRSVSSAIAEEPRHIVHFYEDDRFIVERASRWMASALRAGASGVIVATEAHRLAIEARLPGLGVDLGGVWRQERLVMLDAAATLARFMMSGAPDPDRFDKVIRTVVAKASERSPNRFVLIFGEMVALLCAANNPEAAIRLEQLWNELAKSLQFSLDCAYPLSVFVDRGEADLMVRICAEHSLALPAENPL
jgi:hypothetical protein